MNPYLIRQYNIIPEGILSTPIVILGAGAIGSHTTLALAKMGFTRLTVFDFDLVSQENMNAQGYGRIDIGKPKVEALSETIEDHAGIKIDAIAKAYQGGRLGGIIVTAVDSMEVRRLAWDQNKANPDAKWFIDPRMAAETALLFTMDPNDPNDIHSYEKSLYSDGDAMQESCTAKATIYTAYLLSGMVVKAIKDVLTNQKYPRVMTWDIKGNDQVVWNK